MIVRTTSRIYSFILNYNIGILACLILAASVNYYVNAERIRAITKPNNPDAFADGDIVLIKAAIDGDELLIEKGGVQTNLRILGIKSFNPSLSDPLLSEYGQVCFQYLQTNIKNKKARLKISDKGVGDEGRLLGTIFTNDLSGEYSIDLGKDLISKGYSMVYTRYDFELMPEYLQAEEKAKAANAGFWSNEKITARAESMKKLWEEEKLID